MRNQIIQYWRVLACICIVFHHSVCIISGCWPPLGYSLIDNIPSWIEVLSLQSKTFGLMGFTFISGAVLAYANKKYDSFIQLLWKKTKRIIFPALIFGGVYWLLFPTLMFDTWPAPINGTHLWYLPMIFLCIILTSAHLYSKNALLWIVPMFFIIKKVAMYVDFRTLNEFLCYYPIFYSGYVANSLLCCSEKFRKSLLQFTRFNNIILVVIIFFSVILFSKVCGRVNGIRNIPIAIYIGICYTILHKITQYVENGNLYSKHVEGKMLHIIDMLDRNSFGIYIIHQFILNIWGLYGREILCGCNIYTILSILCVTAFIGALALSELYNTAIRFIRNYCCPLKLK